MGVGGGGVRLLERKPSTSAPAPAALLLQNEPLQAHDVALPANPAAQAIAPKAAVSRIGQGHLAPTRVCVKV